MVIKAHVDVHAACVVCKSTILPPDDHNPFSSEKYLHMCKKERARRIQVDERSSKFNKKKSLKSRHKNMPFTKLTANFLTVSHIARSAELKVFQHASVLFSALEITYAGVSSVAVIAARERAGGGIVSSNNMCATFISPCSFVRTSTTRPPNRLAPMWHQPRASERRSRGRKEQREREKEREGEREVRNESRKLFFRRRPSPS